MENERTEQLSIAEQAARWLYALQRDPGEQKAFGVWLEESPRHVEEYLLASAVYRQFDGFKSAPVEVATLLQAAPVNVVSLRNEAKSPAALQSSSHKHWWAAAAAVLVCAVGTLVFLAGNAREYSTDIGQQSTFDLADGSTLSLNTDSRVRVDFSDDRRAVQLLAGEALFKVARDPARPFEVAVDKAVIRAVGTQFNVYRRPADTKVSVLEGAVKIGDEQQLFKAGDEGQVNPAGAVTNRSTTDVAHMATWRERRLVFQGERLAEVAQEFNRYNRSPRIRVTGKAAADKRLMGIFDANDPASLILFLQQYGDLEVRSTADEVVIRER